MENRYFRIDWNHPAPTGPIQFWYEVTPDGGVSRLIECFPDGSAQCDSVDWYKGREDQLHGVDSLIEGDWERGTEGMISMPDPSDAEPTTLCAVSSDEFEQVWRKHCPESS